MSNSRRGTKHDAKANTSEFVEVGEKIIEQENVESGHVCIYFKYFR